MKNGKALIFSAPSGAGKTTIVKHLVGKFSQLAFSVSATTRNPRIGIEENGVDYHFLSLSEFKDSIKGGKLIEWEEVYEGILYGTLKSEINRIWLNNQVVVFDVDVKGGLTLKRYFKDNALAIFVKAPDLKTLEDRLKGRKTEAESDLQKRLQKVQEEMKYESEFDMTIVNEVLEESLLNAEKITADFIKL